LGADPPDLTGNGYFIVAANGRAFSFGDALGEVRRPAGRVELRIDFAVRPF
jgi:hypothetical protein